MDFPLMLVAPLYLDLHKNHALALFYFILLSASYDILLLWQISFPDFSNYDPNLAWPLILDNFVEWMKEKQT